MIWINIKLNDCFFQTTVNNDKIGGYWEALFIKTTEWFGLQDIWILKFNELTQSSSNNYARLTLMYRQLNNNTYNKMPVLSDRAFSFCRQDGGAKLSHEIRKL